MLEDQKKKNPRIAPQRLPRTGKKMQTKDNEGEQSKQNFLQYHRLVNYVNTLEQLALLQSLQSLSGVQDGSHAAYIPGFLTPHLGSTSHEPPPKKRRKNFETAQEKLQNESTCRGQLQAKISAKKKASAKPGLRYCLSSSYGSTPPRSHPKAHVTPSKSHSLYRRPQQNPHERRKTVPTKNPAKRVARLSHLLLR